MRTIWLISFKIFSTVQLLLSTVLKTFSPSQEIKAYLRKKKPSNKSEYTKNESVESETSGFYLFFLPLISFVFQVDTRVRKKTKTIKSHALVCSNMLFSFRHFSSIVCMSERTILATE